MEKIWMVKLKIILVALSNLKNEYKEIADSLKCSSEQVINIVKKDCIGKIIRINFDQIVT
jgi:hypothetical protein